jgi:hypothetical protein
MAVAARQQGGPVAELATETTITIKTKATVAAATVVAARWQRKHGSEGVVSLVASRKSPSHYNS